MDERGLGLTLGAIGLGLLALGLLIWTGGLGWFGKLPGDIRIERDGLRVYVPLVSMLLVSAVLSVVLWLVRRLW
jgi:hypothetical protein